MAVVIRRIFHTALAALVIASMSRTTIASAQSASAAADPQPEVQGGTGGPEVRFSGRLYLDFAWFDDDEIALEDQQEATSARLRLRVDFNERWRFSISGEFADHPEYKSTYLSYRYGEEQYAFFGNFKQPFSLDELTSSRYSPFMDRSVITEFAPGRNMGTGIETGLGGGYLAAGAFVLGEDFGETGDGHGLAGRYWWPFLDADGHGLHLGAALALEDVDDDVPVRFRVRPGADLSPERFLDTGDIEAVADLTQVGLESIWFSERLILQGEYIVTRVEPETAPVYQFDGWYASATWLMGGGRRKYRPDSGNMGAVRNHGPGVFELAARYDHIDLTDRDITGGIQDSITAGLNWYPVPNLRFMFHVIRVLDVDRPGDEADGETPTTFQIRVQGEF